jgi:soluble lytic murein transglycosylase
LSQISGFDMRFLVFVLHFFAVAAFLPTTLKAQQNDGALLASALAAASAGDWPVADQVASQMQDSAGRDIITWQRLRRGDADFNEYVTFLNQNSDWPGLQGLRAKGEAAMPADASPDQVLAYFTTQLPQTGTGSLQLANALLNLGRTKEARAEAIRTWSSLALDEQDEAAYLEKFQDTLRPHHQKRLDFLLWESYTHQAERMLPFVSLDQQNLANARIALQRALKGVDAAIAAVPNKLRNDPGLNYDRFVWRARKDRTNEVIALLAEMATTNADLGQPEKWASRRRLYARRAMRDGNSQLAYLIASNHGLQTGEDYADLEWLAGYLALNKLNKPDLAVSHFNNHKNVVGSPISLGRAGYWIGRAQEARKDFDAAVDAFSQGARHQTSFYGQLSAEKIAAEPDQSLTGTAVHLDWRNSALLQSSHVRAGVLLHAANEPNLMRWFFSHIAETAPLSEITMLAEIALDLNEPFVALGIAKEAAQRGFILPKSYFPVTDLASMSGTVPPEAAMAIARRESEFNANAASPVGARGLMQVMPATARQVAEGLGIEYSEDKLSNDWRYNVQLGTTYLGGLIERYNGSYILAFAAYNAGPNRADQWIKDYGDPRDGITDPIDWIEHIPFRETRNYVMRVTESLYVYRARLTGKTEPIAITKDLRLGKN